MAIRHTYSSRRRAHPYSYSSSRDTSPIPPSRDSAKRIPFKSLDNQKPILTESKPDKKGKKPAKDSSKLIQMFFDAPNAMKSCSRCALSYTAGVPDDEILHKRHCSRVTRGLEWTKEEEKEADRASLRVIEEFVPIKGGKELGRIIAVDCNSGGKIGQKISAVMETINLCLSAPAVAPSALENSRAYLFLLPSSKESMKEIIVGAILLTRIEEAMRIAQPDITDEQPGLVIIDSGLYCYSERVPAAMGVSRLFVSTTHRRKGIARLLLTAGAKTFIHGCPLRIEDGTIAFSQPTGSGRSFMESFGRGYIRIYEE